MNIEEQKRIVLDFIRKHKLAVVATTGTTRRPEAAVLEYVVNDNLEIVFDSLPTFRKVRNINENPQVAVVIGGEDDKTVQYEGPIAEIKGAEVEEYRQLSLAKYPNSAEIIKEKGLIWYKVTPRWIRYLDVSTKPWQQFEINL